jgi:hypothetical protein
MIYQWKALGKENMLEQLFSSFIHCASLASKKKELGCGSELADESYDRTN